MKIVSVSNKRRKKNVRLTYLVVFALLVLLAAGWLFLRMRMVAKEPVVQLSVSEENTAVSVKIQHDQNGQEPYEEAIPQVETMANVPSEELPPSEPAGSAQETPPPKKRIAGVRMTDAEGNDVFKLHPEFKTKTDRFLFGLLSQASGRGHIVLSTYKIEEDFEKSLSYVIESTPEDTDEEKAIKLEIEEIKKELAERKENGESVRELFEELRDQNNLAAMERAEARKKLYDLIKSGDFDAAEIYLTAINNRFTDEGILPLKIPSRVLKRAIAKHGEEYLARKKALDDIEATLGAPHTSNTPPPPVGAKALEVAAPNTK